MKYSESTRSKDQLQHIDQNIKTLGEKKLGFANVEMGFKPLKSTNPLPKSDRNNNSGIISAREMIENDITEVPMLWGNLLQKNGIAVLSGSSDTGKSTFLRQLSLAIVTHQKEYLGIPLTPIHNRVIYLSTEDDLESLSPRLKAERITSANPMDYENLSFIFEYGDNIKESIRIIKREFDKNPADCIIIDTWGDFAEGDQNTALYARSSLKPLKNFARNNKCLIIINHHNRKSATDTSISKDNVLGSQSIEAKARVVLMLTVDPMDYTKRMLTVAKGNYIPDKFKQKSILIQTDENFIFKYHSDLKPRVKERNIDHRDKENKNEVERLIKEGKSRQEIIDIVQKKLKNHYKRSKLQKMITDASNNKSMSTE